MTQIKFFKYRHAVVLGYLAENGDLCGVLVSDYMYHVQYQFKTTFSSNKLKECDIEDIRHYLLPGISKLLEYFNNSEH